MEEILKPWENRIKGIPRNKTKQREYKIENSNRIASVYHFADT